VRVHVGERALTTWIVLDTSASMTFGTADRRKIDVAEGVALAVGHVASRRGNRLGVAAFGAATHLVVWLRRYVRGQHGRRRAVVRFAWLVLALQVAAFACGNLMYPTYRVEVRAAYLENGPAVVEDAARRQRDLAAIAAREGGPAGRAPVTGELVRRAEQGARWFDVKEHAIALGIFGAAGLLMILAWWDPRRDGTAIAPIALGLAGFVACTLWLGAIIGVLTAAWRAV
jgi:hypothetical protein